RHLGEAAIRPRAIAAHGESLDAESRSAIEAAFRGPAFDTYSSREFGPIAHECSAHDGYHVAAEGYVVELVAGDRPAPPGEPGEVVITDLTNYCLPFIRYAIGDTARASADAGCACGRGLPKIDGVEGLRASFVCGRSGRWIPSEFFSDVLRGHEYAV